MAASETPAVELDPRAVALVAGIPGMDRMRLLFCFQSLGLPKGMLLTRGFTRTEAARRINAVLGCKGVTRSSKPPRDSVKGEALANYLSWAIAEAERRNPGLRLEVVTADGATV